MPWSYDILYNVQVQVISTYLLWSLNCFSVVIPRMINVTNVGTFSQKGNLGMCFLWFFPTYINSKETLCSHLLVHSSCALAPCAVHTKLSALKRWCTVHRAGSTGSSTMTVFIWYCLKTIRPFCLLKSWPCKFFRSNGGSNDKANSSMA